MTAEFKRNRMRSSANLLIKRLSRYMLFAIIIALIPVFVALVMRSSNPGRLTGIVESESETVGSVDDSRIISIEVFPGQKVNPGDVLVRLAPTARSVDLAMNEARLMDYQQSLIRYRGNQIQYKQSLLETTCKYRQLVEEADVELEQEKMKKARDEAELKGLKDEIKKLQPLVENRVVSEVELAGIRPRITTLELTINHYDPLVKALQRRLEKAKDGLKEVIALQESLNTSNEKNPIELALQKAHKACENLSEVEPSVLRATRAGIVSRIQHQAGDVVSAGEPIIRIASKSSMYITGFLPQGSHDVINVGDSISVSRINGDAEAPILTAQVETIDPEVMDLIDPFNPSPRTPIRGRRMRLRIVSGDHTLIPGETVYLHTSKEETFIESMKHCFIPGAGVKQQLLFTNSR